jgi:hypothetical protein
VFLESASAGFLPAFRGVSSSTQWEAILTSTIRTHTHTARTHIHTYILAGAVLLSMCKITRESFITMKVRKSLQGML